MVFTRSHHNTNEGNIVKIVIINYLTFISQSTYHNLQQMFNRRKYSKNQNILINFTSPFINLCLKHEIKDDKKAYLEVCEDFI